MDIITKKLDKNDKIALKHAKKENLWKALMLIELQLQRKTGSQLNETEKYIDSIIREYTQHLYFNN